MTKEGDCLVLENIEARVAVKSLSTGMSVRDEHMRKYVFTSPDGQTPDVQFTAEKVTCSRETGKPDYACQVPGVLNIRGTPRPLVASLKAKAGGSTSQGFRVTGSAVVKLSDYDITPPTQFGVKVSNDVRFEFEFTGKGKTLITSGAGPVQ